MNARAHLSPRRLPVIWGVACALGLAAAASRAGGDEADAAQPAAPTALSCGGDIIPILKAVDDLQRERTVLARQGDSPALKVVEARLAAAEAIRLFAFSRYAGTDPADALAAMRGALAQAEALPLPQRAELVASARGTLSAMIAASDTMRLAGSAPARP